MAASCYLQAGKFLGTMCASSEEKRPKGDSTPLKHAVALRTATAPGGVPCIGWSHEVRRRGSMVLLCLGEWHPAAQEGGCFGGRTFGCTELLPRRVHGRSRRAAKHALRHVVHTCRPHRSLLGRTRSSSCDTVHMRLRTHS